MEKAPRDRCALLTPREREVAALMAAGLSNAAIGRALWVSPKTVETHVRAVLAKLVDADDEEPCHRRVVAVLVFLAGTTPAAPSPDGPVARRHVAA